MQITRLACVAGVIVGARNTVLAAESERCMKPGAEWEAGLWYFSRLSRSRSSVAPALRRPDTGSTDVKFSRVHQRQLLKFFS